MISSATASGSALGRPAGRPTVSSSSWPIRAAAAATSSVSARAAGASAAGSAAAEHLEGLLDLGGLLGRCRLDLPAIGVVRSRASRVNPYASWYSAQLDELAVDDGLLVLVADRVQQATTITEPM